MALTSGSKILASDVSGKIDTAGTGLSKSGTTLSLATVTTSGGTAGPTADATPSYGATFTVPKVVYDAYGRVTGHTNYTVKIPAAPSGGSATLLSGVAVASKPNAPSNCACYGGMTVSYTGSPDTKQGVLKLPSGGTWRWITTYSSGGESSGGTTILEAYTFSAIAIRIA